MTDTSFPRSVIVYGTGLMGCSFALAVRKRIAGVQVYGVDSPEILDRACQLGAIEPGEARSAELVVLAAPVGAILDLLDDLTPDLGLILDVGSTKVTICRKAEGRGLPFVGGHPMTGLERSGPEAASAELFSGAPFFLCPVSTTPGDAIPKLKQLLQVIGAKPVIIGPEQHDSMVAQLSHLPQIISTLLADQTSTHRAFAGPGWKSVTRLGGSPFRVWRDILQTSGSLPQELRSFSARLNSFLAALEAGELTEIEAIFERANRSVAGRDS